MDLFARWSPHLPAALHSRLQGGVRNAGAEVLIIDAPDKLLDFFFELSGSECIYPNISKININLPANLLEILPHTIRSYHSGTPYLFKLYNKDKHIRLAADVHFFMRALNHVAFWSDYARMYVVGSKSPLLLIETWVYVKSKVTNQPYGVYYFRHGKWWPSIKLVPERKLMGVKGG